jgi:hypothetical protein
MKCACCADSKKRGRRKNRKLGRLIRHRENEEIRRRILEDYD